MRTFKEIRYTEIPYNERNPEPLTSTTQNLPRYNVKMSLVTEVERETNQHRKIQLIICCKRTSYICAAANSISLEMKRDAASYSGISFSLSFLVKTGYAIFSQKPI